MNSIGFDVGRLTLVSLAVLLVASCSREDAVCGSVKPERPTEIESRMLSVAKRQSFSFCSVQGASCELTAYETRGGRTVRVSRVFAQDGKCIGALGDEKFYSFDESGKLIRIVNGI